VFVSVCVSMFVQVCVCVCACVCVCVRAYVHVGSVRIVCACLGAGWVGGCACVEGGKHETLTSQLCSLRQARGKKPLPPHSPSS